MKEALALAAQGAGWVNPNPMVGALVVRDGEIVGRGFHHRFGEAHAEVHALKEAGELSRGATLYVTLEPCSHHGKTPPCCEAVVEAGITRVVCPGGDPNPLVSGKGFAYLEAHGVKVETGLMQKEALSLNEIFFHFIQKKRPYVILKSAMSLDGKIATRTQESRWITSSETRTSVHLLRHSVMAIMVGVDTLIADDPLLTTRLEGKAGSHPIRIVMDSKGRTPLTAQVFQSLDLSPLIIVTTSAISPRRKDLYREAGAEVITLASKGRSEMIDELLPLLAERGIDSILVEGGSTLNESCVQSGCVDRYIACIAPMIIGGKDAPSPVGGTGFSRLSDVLRFREVEVTRIGDDTIITARTGEDLTCSQD